MGTFALAKCHKNTPVSTAYAVNSVRLAPNGRQEDARVPVHSYLSFQHRPRPFAPSGRLFAVIVAFNQEIVYETGLQIWIVSADYFARPGVAAQSAESCMVRISPWRERIGQLLA